MGKRKLNKKCDICCKEYISTNFKKWCSEECYLNRRTSTYSKEKSQIENCDFCNARVLKYESERKGNLTTRFCNNSCATKYRELHSSVLFVELTCKNCNSKFSRAKSHIITNTNNHYFCRYECSQSYNGKILGKNSKNVKVSKLEKFISDKIEQNFPYLKLIKSDREILDGLEIDIYLPDIQLGLEINGPIHSKPIFGEKYLENLQKRDNRKLDLCSKLNISLYILQNIRKFSIDYGEELWKTLIKPKITSMVPFCEPEKE